MFHFVALAQTVANGDGMTDFQTLAMIIGFVAGIIAFVINLIAVIVAVYKMGRAVERFETIGIQQAVEIKELKEAVTRVTELVTEMALQSQRLDTIEERIGSQRRLIEDLREGKGWILPPSVSPYQVGRPPPSSSEGR